MQVFIDSENVKYTENHIETKYEYRYTGAEKTGNNIKVVPKKESLIFRTQRKIPKFGVMLVGWGGNNGSTFTASLIANKLKLSWPTRRGNQSANWFGSITQASTINLGNGVNVPLGNLLPMLNPDEIILDGWDISEKNLAESMDRAQVLEPALKDQLRPFMEKFKPRPSIYAPDFIAANQSSRADNLIAGTKLQQVYKICEDIKDFKDKNKLERIIIVWTANTERFSEIIQGVNDTFANLKDAIESNHSEISPSTLFAYASISMGCPYINGSPQNTFVPGLIEYAESKNVFVSGDDFKSGQTKIKSVIVDFLVSAGIKPVSIVSYNHLGNNDGKNLSAPAQFRSKEISKSNVVDDVVRSNSILYGPGEKPDHVVVIKYVPYVGDSKRAMDEYTSEIMMGGLNTIAIHNTCEDSLLATPIILDLIVLTELFTRIKVKRGDEHSLDEEFSSFHAVLSALSYLCKAPLVPEGAPLVNALFRQKACIENILRACVGLPPDNNMLLEFKIPFLMDHLSEPPRKKSKYI